MKSAPAAAALRAKRSSLAKLAALSQGVGSSFNPARLKDFTSPAWTMEQPSTSWRSTPQKYVAQNLRDLAGPHVMVPPLPGIAPGSRSITSARNKSHSQQAFKSVARHGLVSPV